MNQPKMAIILGFIIAAGLGYVAYLVKYRTEKADKFNQIEKIDKMKSKGLLSQEEFETEKKKILEKKS